MKRVTLLVFLIVIGLLSVAAKRTMALDEAQQKEIQKARILLLNERIEEAKKIFEELSQTNGSDFEVRRGIIDTTIEEARILKSGDMDGWKNKVYTAFTELENIYRTNATSPEIFLAFAKCYWINNRTSKAEKSLKKAFYYSPNYSEAYIFRGDMYLAEAKKIKASSVFDNYESDNNIKMRRMINRAKSSYESAITIGKMNDTLKATAYYKPGEFNSYIGDEVKAIDHWRKGAAISGDDHWSRKSQLRLSELNK